jgi:hypothetical protein
MEIDRGLVVHEKVGTALQQRQYFLMAIDRGLSSQPHYPHMLAFQLIKFTERIKSFLIDQGSSNVHRGSTRSDHCRVPRKW